MRKHRMLVLFVILLLLVGIVLGFAISAKSEIMARGLLHSAVTAKIHRQIELAGCNDNDKDSWNACKSDNTPKLGCEQRDENNQVRCDCDDNDPNVNPDAQERTTPEICDYKDNNCEGYIDQSLDSISEDICISCGCPGYIGKRGVLNNKTICYCQNNDTDQDGWNTFYHGMYYENGNLIPGHGAFDCNNNDSNINPNAPEICGNYIDDDCDEKIDGQEEDCRGIDSDGDGIPAPEDCEEGNPNIWAYTVYYHDDDQDGHATYREKTICSNGQELSGFQLTPGTDCDDKNESVYQWLRDYADQDNDSYTQNTLEYICSGATSPIGYQLVPSRIDCEDNPNDDIDQYIATGILTEEQFDKIDTDKDGAIADQMNPRGIEICNGVDDNCNGLTDAEEIEGCGGEITDCQQISSPGVYILQNNIVTDGNCFHITSNGVTLNCRGNEIALVTESPYDVSGIFLDHVSDVKIKSCKIKYPHGYGIIIKNGKRIGVTSNILEGTEYGIVLSGGSNNSLLLNTLMIANGTTEEARGIDLYNTLGNIIEGNNISCSDPKKKCGLGIAMSNSNGNGFKNNVFEKSYKAVELAGSSGNTFESNDFGDSYLWIGLSEQSNLNRFTNNRMSSSNKCFQIENSNRNEFSDNVLHSCKKYQAFLFSSSRVNKILNNDIVSDQGLSIWGSSNEIIGNTIIYRKYGVALGSDSRGNIFKDNMFSGISVKQTPDVIAPEGVKKINTFVGNKWQ